MSRHTIELPASTSSGRALVSVGYDNGVRGPHYFCYIFDATEPMATPLFNSLFSLGHMNAQQVSEFDAPLAQWGISLPDFISKALGEDWAKNQLDCDYCWQDDGTFDQIR